MGKFVTVEGPVQRFNGLEWEDITYTVPIEVTIVGDQDMWTHATVTGDVPVRWMRDEPSVRIRTTEAVLL